MTPSKTNIHQAIIIHVTESQNLFSHSWTRVDGRSPSYMWHIALVQPTFIPGASLAWSWGAMLVLSCWIEWLVLC